MRKRRARVYCNADQGCGTVLALRTAHRVFSTAAVVQDGDTSLSFMEGPVGALACRQRSISAMQPTEMLHAL